MSLGDAVLRTALGSLFLLALGLFFAWAESRWPARLSNWRGEWRLQAGAFLVTLLAWGSLYTWLVAGFTAAVGPRLEAYPVAPAWLKVVLIVFVVDLASYWMHRLMHANRTLWAMHRWHHSVQALTWFSGVRGSLLHIVVMGIPLTLCLVLGRFTPAEAAASSVLWSVLLQLFNHTNLRVRAGWLGRMFVLPQVHRLHHAAPRALADRNFGFLWTFWDRAFGTWLDPDEVGEEYPLGLEEEPGHARMAVGL